MEKIKAIQRIPTENYAYIELELEYDTVEEAFIDHQRLLKMHEAGTGLDARKWKQVREYMYLTGECDPADLEQMNKAQRYFINEMKLIQRSLKADDPVVE